MPFIISIRFLKRVNCKEYYFRLGMKMSEKDLNEAILKKGGPTIIR